MAPGKVFDASNINEVKIRLRVTKSYQKFNPEFGITRIVSGNNGIVAGQLYVANKATTYNGVLYAIDACFTGIAGVTDIAAGGDVSPCQNCKLPFYEFNTDGVLPVKASTEEAKKALAKFDWE